MNHTLNHKQTELLAIPRFTIFSWLIIISLLSSCKSDKKSDDVLPAPLKDTVALNITPSVFNIPITYSLESLAGYVNHKLSGDFLETIIRPENKKHLEIGLKIRRTGNIKFYSDSKEITCIVPIRAEASILNSGVNIVTKGLKPVITELTVELKTNTALDADWNLITNFELVNTTWTLPPKLKVLGINFDLQKSIEKVLREDKDMLTSLLDDEINKGVSLKKAVGKVWDDLQNPIPVSKEEPYVFLKFICDSIAGDFILSDTAVTCLTSIVAQVGLITDTTGSADLKKPLPPFTDNDTDDTLSDVHLHLIVGFEDINRALKHQLVGNTFSTSGMSLTIRNVKVYGSDMGMIVQLSATGSLEGDLIATATPYFDSTAQRLSFEAFDFEVISNNTMLQLADVFLHNMIRDSIQAGLGLELNTVLTNVPKIIHKAVSKGKTGKTIDINVRDMRISSCNLVLDSESIHLNVHTYFFADMLLKHINPGKTLMVRPKNKAQPPKEEKK